MSDRPSPRPDVAVIGAGPAGAVVSALLAQRGWRVLVLEREQFPRFSIGESLLPQCMAFLEQAGMLQAVNDAGFQYKNGAAFSWGERGTEFDFRDKFSAGPGETFQVQRARFDQLLADQAAVQGVEIRYRQQVEAIAHEPDGEVRLDVRDLTDDSAYAVTARFVLDASGFGRVLPRLLDLDRPSDFPVRRSLFTHVADHIDDPSFDRDKILISVHPQERALWYWLIPFSDGRCSLGVVGEEALLARYQGDAEARLRQAVADVPRLRQLLADAEFDTPVREIRGYAAKVSQLWGPGYALLGNAAEFLDPVFSSGVTIAMKSAVLAAPLVDRQLRGAAVDWQEQFAAPLQAGVDTFRCFVEAWYDGVFQDIIFHPNPPDSVRQMICAILAGYAWDRDNPYVRESERRLQALAEICAG